LRIHQTWRRRRTFWFFDMVGTICGKTPTRIRLMEKSGDSCCAHLKNFGEKFG
jgi:hypothetical protein